MIKHGYIINPNYDPLKIIVYETFDDYFNNPIVNKIKDIEQYSVYMTKIFSMIGNSYRYLILFVDKDSNNINFKQPMKNCEWISLQTRTLDDYHNRPSNKYKFTQIPELKQKITIKTRDEKHSVYDCENFPLSVTLLHTRKNFSMQYQNIGDIITALETYQTIFNFK